jgi:predicted amidohydrolase YtcJ
MRDWRDRQLRYPFLIVSRLLVAVFAISFLTCTHMQSERVIIHGGTILTGASAGTLRDGAIVIEGDRIVAVTSWNEAQRIAPGAKVIDASRFTVLPGLIDAHAHIEGLGLALERVDLTGAVSAQEVASRAAARARETAEGEWILGRGWDQNRWSDTSFPEAAVVDAAVSDRPVWLRRVDGHAGLANTAAMRAAGITRDTPDPKGGQIFRDAEGKPTGVFIDTAMDLVEKAVPQPSREQRKRAILAATRMIAANGLTGVHDAGVDEESVAIFRELAESGELPVRVYLMLGDDAALLERWFARGVAVDPRHMVTVRSVKLYADGALGSRGAALLAPYSDQPDHRGLMIAATEHMRDVAERARRAGFQVNTHAIGDRGVRNVLDAYEGAGVRPGDRFRIEHFQIAALEDIPRTARMGVIASMQPTHATSDSGWAEARVGPQRILGGYAWRKVLNANGRLALGSDFPVEEVSPFLGLWAAVDRGGWHTEEALTVDEAIRGFTIDAAFAAFQERVLGTIEPAKLADFTIIDRNPHEVPPAELKNLRPLYTIVGGRVVFSDGGL